MDGKERIVQQNYYYYYITTLMYLTQRHRSIQHTTERHIRECYRQFAYATGRLSAA